MPRRLLLALALTLLLPLAPRMVAQTAQARMQPSPTMPVAADADEADAHEGSLVHTLRAQLIAEQFDEIDRTAEQFRRDKARWTGGKWKLRTLYEALDAPHETDKDTVEHLGHLEHWMRLRPESITARVALATSLTRWAWVARGNGLANTVTAEGWQLFGQRIQEAQAVLEGSRDMKTMCPQWYLEQMIVGLAQGWDGRRIEEVFNRAVQFEPDFPYFYKQRANYLLPKWYGQPNDATTFAKTSADRLGGDTGDAMYFEIATVIIKRGNGKLDGFVKAMDWLRIQRGFQIMESQYGHSNSQQNRVAFMAYKFGDRAAAQQLLVSIGDNWNDSVWRDRNFYNKVRDWSTGHQSWP
jgi:hypothetical protein